MSARVLVVDDSATITRVVSLTLSRRGYQVLSAPDGEQGFATARAQRPDLMLVDFVMPRMNGYEFCAAVRDDFTLHDVPIVLMSAKGDQIGDRFVKTMGIADYLSKPFSADVLVSAVEKALARSPSARLSWTATSAAPEAVTPADSARLLLVDGLRRAGVTADGAVGAAVESVLPDLMRTLERANHNAVIRGDLARMPVAPVLTLLGAQHASGLLVLERDAQGAMLHFRHGRIEQAIPSGNPDLALGRFLHHLEDADLTVLLSTQANTGRLLGDQAVVSGRASDSQIAAALRAQTRAVLFDALRWRSGSFVFAEEPPPPHVTNLALGLEVDRVLLEGFRQIDEWYLIEPVVGSMDLVFLRNDEAIRNLPIGSLTHDETRVLDIINGKYTVRDIVRKTALGTFAVSKILFHMASVQLIRRRVSAFAVE